MKGTYFYLENTNGGHSKCYLAAALEDGRTCLHWGKIGTKGQQQEYSTADPESINEVQRKVTSKRRGGYDLLVNGLVLDILPGQLWSDPFWSQHDQSGPVVVAPVSCEGCGAGGWDLTGWATVEGKLVCPSCQ